MASGWTTKGLEDIFKGVIDLDSDTIKLMLVDDDFVFSSALAVVDNGQDDTSDPSAHELVATNYTAGFGGAGRKAVTVTVQLNNSDGRLDIALSDVTWSSLGGAANDVIGGALLIKENTNDADSRVIAFFDLTDTPTNGSDITNDFATIGNGGNLRITV